MKRMFQVILTFVVAICSSFAQEQEPTNFENNLIGHWIFNKPETIENFSHSDMSDAEFKKFSSILKPSEIVITDKFYSGHIKGRKPTKTPYSIISISGNRECFKLQLEDTRIPLDIQKLELCIVNNRLLLPSVKGAKEIYNRKL